MIQKRGKFIVVEGGDGSGKSSCITYLVEKLNQRKDVVFTREPGGTVVGELIRRIVQDPSIDEIDIKTDLLLYSAARAEHLAKIIAPSIQGGINVICDRFDLSTWAYQVYARDNNASADFFEKLNSFVIGANAPDLYILLDVSPEIGMERSSKRKEALSRFDKKHIAFRTVVRDGYHKYIANLPHIIINVDKLSLEEVRELLLQKILRLIPPH